MKNNPKEGEHPAETLCILQVFDMDKETYSYVAIFPTPVEAFDWARSHPLDGDLLLCYTVLQLPFHKASSQIKQLAQEKETPP